jgi:hypothetical protein
MLEQACYDCKDNCHYCCNCDKEGENQYILNVIQVSNGIVKIYANTALEAIEIFNSDDYDIDFISSKRNLEMIRKVE